MTEDVNKTRVFISYSRKDKLFVRKLNDAIDAAGIDAWVDWEGIELASDWMSRITDAIQSSDAFLFVISPDSLKSKICAEELEISIRLNKKIIPILYREPEKRKAMHEKLASTNWVYMRPKKDDFKSTIPKLVDAIKTDLGWVQQHTRLLRRALEWDQKNRDNSYVLQGSELEEGEKWMTESTAHEGRNVVPLQAEYISTSRKVAVQRQRNLTIGIGVIMIISVILGFVALGQSRIAKQNALLAQNNALTAVANQNAASTQQALAEQNAESARKSENSAKAQKSAAMAAIYKDRPGELDASTLLAVESWLRDPSSEAESLLRDNSTLLPTPKAQARQGGRIINIKPSKDGNFVVTSSEDGTACVWTMTGEKKFCATHDGYVFNAFLTADSQKLITAGADGFVRFWDMTGDKPLREFNFGSAVRDMDINPAETLLAVGREDGKISVIDLKTMRTPYEFNFADGEINSVVFDPTGKWLGVANKNGQVRIWRAGAGFSLQGPKHKDEVYKIAFSSDGKWIISGGADSAARVAKAEAGGQIRALEHGDWVEDLAFGPDPSWFVTASDDNIVRVWDTETGVEKVRMAQDSYILRVKVSPDGQWIVSTGYDKTARLWDSVSGALVREMYLDDYGWALAFSPDGNIVYTGDLQGNIIFWDISNAYARDGYLVAPEVVHKVKFSETEDWVLLNSDDKNLWKIKFSDLETIHNLSTAEKVASFPRITVQMKLSPDSNWAAASFYDAPPKERAVLYNIPSKTPYYLPHDGDITGISFNKDSAVLATTNRDGQYVNLWDVKTGALIKQIKFNETPFTISFSPAQTDLLAIGFTGKIVLWNTSTNSALQELKQVGGIRSITYSRDGRLLATSSSEGSIYIWDTSDLSFTKYRFLQNGGITSLDFTQDNAYLASASGTGIAYVWDLKTGEEIIRVHHNNPVEGVSFAPDNIHLVTVSRKIVQVWNLTRFTPLRRETLVETACSRLIRNFSASDWDFFFSGDEPRTLCPSLP